MFIAPLTPHQRVMRVGLRPAIAIALEPVTATAIPCASHGQQSRGIVLGREGEDAVLLALMGPRPPPRNRLPMQRGISTWLGFERCLGNDTKEVGINRPKDPI